MAGRAALLGPESISCGVLRSPIYLIGGIRALLLQLADPAIAAGVAEHSDFADRLLPRLRRTLDLVSAVALAPADQAEQAMAEMRRLHRPVKGELPGGGTYRASDPDLKLWVLATLIDTVFEVEQRYVARWGEADRRQYYEESRLVMGAFGIGRAPADLAGFGHYMRSRLGEVEVGDTARRLARHLFRPRFGPAPPQLFAPLVALNLAMLPESLQRAYGFEPTGRQRLLARSTERAGRAIIPRLPDTIRYFPLLHPIAGLGRGRHRRGGPAWT